MISRRYFIAGVGAAGVFGISRAASANDQSGLALVTNPNAPPFGKITFVPTTTRSFFVGQLITITTYLHNAGTTQVACQAEFFVDSSEGCDPLHINQNVFNSPNPTAAVVLNPGAVVPASFSWIVDKAYGSAWIRAQVRATDSGPLNPCDTQAWNARAGCDFFSQ
jgi:hypothetical protein